MDIVKGRGSKRTVFTFPCATIVNRSPKAEQLLGRDLLCNMLGVSPPQAKVQADVTS